MFEAMAESAVVGSAEMKVREAVVAWMAMEAESPAEGVGAVATAMAGAGAEGTGVVAFLEVVASRAVTVVTVDPGAVLAVAALAAGESKAAAAGLVVAAATAVHIGARMVGQLERDEGVRPGATDARIRSHALPIGRKGISKSGYPASSCLESAHRSLPV